jgi:hypothetical protein
MEAIIQRLVVFLLMELVIRVIGLVGLIPAMKNM